MAEMELTSFGQQGSLAVLARSLKMGWTWTMHPQMVLTSFPCSLMCWSRLLGHCCWHRSSRYSARPPEDSRCRSFAAPLTPKNAIFCAVDASRMDSSCRNFVACSSSVAWDAVVALVVLLSLELWAGGSELDESEAELFRCCHAGIEPLLSLSSAMMKYPVGLGRGPEAVQR